VSVDQTFQSTVAVAQVRSGQRINEAIRRLASFGCPSQVFPAHYTAFLIGKLKPGVGPATVAATILTTQYIEFQR
jgi:hypothetical protein